VGFLSIGRDTRAFAETERDVLLAFGNQVALAIDNYRIIEDLEVNLLHLKDAQHKLLQAARLAAIGELAAGVAHQVNNPLTTIIADSHLLLEQLPPDGKAHESAEAISQAAHRAGVVVQRLLNFSRTKPSELTALDINDGLHRAIDIVRAQVEPNYARLQIDLEPELPLVNASEDHLQDVWINLLLNARDAVAERSNGEIKIISSRASDGKHVTIKIHDNGTGVKSGDRDRIFDPFFTTKKQGTGLGLAVCQDIINHHGGSISVDSQPGEWALFTVTLPVMPEAEGQDTNGENHGN
jgi:two-component system NtrC family sensor kinase